jgi:hypothetical protein
MAIVQTLILCSLLCCYADAVTVIPLTLNVPKPYESPTGPAKSEIEVLQKLHEGTKLDNKIWLSPLSTNLTHIGSINESLGIYPSHDSFVRGAIDASTAHQHLVVQPQDVWLTILKQIGSYLRKHKDDQEVSEKWDNLDGNRDAAPGLHALMISWFALLIEAHFGKRNKTNWLPDWVRPNVGTLTKSSFFENATDEDMIARALMMASSSKATADLPAFPCENGIPSITLLGTRADWKNISDKLDPLIDLKFGKEPAVYGTILRPILSRFVETFDKPNDVSIRQFWSDIITVTPKQKLCHTTDIITGWINAFHYWDGAGDLLTNGTPSVDSLGSASNPAGQVQSNTLVLDNVTYPWRHRKNLPASYSHVNIYMFVDTPGFRSSQLLVGMLAKTIKKGIPEGYDQAMKQVGFKLPSSVQESDHSILRPLPAYIFHDDAAGSVRSPGFHLFNATENLANA